MSKLFPFFIFIYLLCLSSTIYSQNLVVNGTFEDTSATTPCSGPASSGYYEIVNDWHNAANFIGFGSSVDYSCPFATTLFNPTPVNQPSGTGAIGMASSLLGGPKFTEAVTTNLTSSVPAGNTITISFFVSPRYGNGFPPGQINDPAIPFGVYFYGTGNVPEDSSGTLNHHLSATPQVIVPTAGFTINNWHLFSTTYVTTSCVSQVAIGFFNPLNADGTVYRYFAIDNVTVTSTGTGSCLSAPTGSGGNASVCGANAFTFPSRTCSSGTLRWYENNLGTGPFYTSATVVPTTTTTYYPFCFSGSLSAPGNPATATHTCPVSGSGSIWNWTGCTNTDWFNPCNWDRGSIPNTTSNVIIPFTSNQPVISGGTANCYDITVQTGAGAQVNLLSTSGGILNVVKP